MLQKNKHINIRASEQTLSALEALSEKEKMNKSEFLAYLINREYNIKIKGE